MAPASHHILPLLLLSVTMCSPFLAFASSPDKVSLVLYYETLCPYCSNFIVNYLSKIFNNGFLDIVDLTLVPYGNARVGSNASITCQVVFFVVLFLKLEMYLIFLLYLHLGNSLMDFDEIEISILLGFIC